MAVQIAVVEKGIQSLMAEGGPVAKHLGTIGRPVLEAAVRLCPKDTDQLSESLGMSIVHTPGRLEVWVGVLASRNERFGVDLTNAELALIQNYGAPRANVPATHFLDQALLAARR